MSQITFTFGETLMSQFNRDSFEASIIGDVIVVTFLDKKIYEDQQIERIKAKLHLLADAGAKKILMDFIGVEYVNEWYGMLVAFHKKMFINGGKLVMCHMDEEVFERFQWLKLDKLFVIVPNQQAALLYMAQDEADQPIFIQAT